MRKKFILSAAALLPLAIVIILAVFGATLSVWVYIVLAVVCPLVVGIIWFLYKYEENKIKNAQKEAGRRSKSS